MSTFAKPFLMMLVFAAMLAPASCQCSRGQQERPTEQQELPRPETLAEQSFRLQNGLDVDLVSGPCGDTAAMVVLLKSGIDHDPAGRSGMSHLVERLLATSGKAAERSVRAGTDYILYSVVATGDRLGDEIDAVAAWMSSAPTDADLARERMNVLQDLAKLQGADAARAAHSMAEESLQPSRGNGKRRGIVAEVEAITLADLQTFWNAHIKPGNARIVISGRFEPAAIKTRVETAFDNIAAGTPPALRNPADSSVRGTLVMGDAPSAVAIAIAAPAMSDPGYAAFLMLAARLMEKPATPRTWDAVYDPIYRPEILFITGPVGQAEQPEPAAGRMRTEANAILARPLESAEVEKTRETFRLLFEHRSVDPAICSKDARAFAVARARGAQLQLDAGPITKTLDKITKEELDEAAKAFDAKRSAAVIAGGVVR